MFVREAFRTLCTDEHFMTLLRAEGLETMPADLAQAVTDGPSS
jgi:ParB family chromosome partitioning protein